MRRTPFTAYGKRCVFLLHSGIMRVMFSMLSLGNGKGIQSFPAAVQAVFSIPHLLIFLPQFQQIISDSCF